MRRLAMLFGCAVLVSCSSPTSPDDLERLGLIMKGDPSMTSLVAPGTVQRGASFVVTVGTFGSGSCTHPDGYDLTAGSNWAEIRVYDSYSPPGTPCTLDLRRFSREVVLRFDRTGIARVTLIGRGEDGKVTSITQAIAVVR